MAVICRNIYGSVLLLSTYCRGQTVYFIWTSLNYIIKLTILLRITSELLKHYMLDIVTRLYFAWPTNAMSLACNHLRYNYFSYTHVYIWVAIHEFISRADIKLLLHCRILTSFWKALQLMSLHHCGMNGGRQNITRCTTVS